MLPSAEMYFENAILPIPKFLMQLNGNHCYQIGNQIFFNPVDLEAEDGRILRILDGEMYENCDDNDELRLILANKYDPKNWFTIRISFDSSWQFVRRLEFSQWKMQVNYGKKLWTK